jgi:Fe-Mn family superoxide dismutase
MKKREFIKISTMAAAGATVSPLFTSCNSGSSNDSGNAKTVSNGSGDFSLPDLPYNFDSLAPNIDARTMEIHHGKHHAGYVRKLNAALDGNPNKGMKLDVLLAGLGDADTAIRNNGGGHYNHSLFWSVMRPTGGEGPSGALGDAINAAFGSFDDFKKVFSTAAKTRFGSGWAWLCKGSDNKLFVTSTPNQDNPLMTNLVDQNGTPILGLDVWEHAYYLNYQNRRGDYVENFFNIINWEEVAKRLVA